MWQSQDVALIQGLPARLVGYTCRNLVTIVFWHIQWRWPWLIRPCSFLPCRRHWAPHISLEDDPAGIIKTACMDSWRFAFIPCLWRRGTSICQCYWSDEEHFTLLVPSRPIYLGIKVWLYRASLELDSVLHWSTQWFRRCLSINNV